MYFGECAVSNQVDIALYENDNLLGMINEIFDTDGDQALIEANIKEIGKSIWNAILRILRTLKTAFNNLLLNINYFKNAEMDEDYNKDLLEVLKTLNINTLNETELLSKFFRILHKFGADVTGDLNQVTTISMTRNLAGGVTDFEFEVQKGVTDIDESIESGKSSKAYERIQKNEYDNKNMTKVPLSNIVPDMKSSNSKLTYFINELDKQSSFTEKLPEDNKEVKELSGKVITFLKKMIEYFKFRISILQNYFKAAKASIDAVKNNIKEKKEGNNTTGHKIVGGLKNISRKTVTVKDVAALKECMGNLKTYNKELDFSKYKEEYKKFADMLGTSATSGIIIMELDEDTGKATVGFTNNKYEKINVGSRKLYHYSQEEEGSEVDKSILSEGLRPNALGNKSGAAGFTLYYPEPRVYLHLSVPKTFGNNKVGGDMVQTMFGFGPTKPMKDVGMKGCVYEIEGTYDVYRDPEYNGTAAFIVSDKPVKCKRVDMDKWYKDREVKPSKKEDKKEEPEEKKKEE